MPSADVLTESVKYIGVYFGAKYCPPCEKFLEPLRKFNEEMSKAGNFQLVTVNCDRREQEYAEYLCDGLQWCHAVPFSAQEVIEGLEDRAHASTIPMLSVFSVEKGFDKPTAVDVKQIILRNENMAEAVEQVLAKIKQGEETYDVSSNKGETERQPDAEGVAE